MAGQVVQETGSFQTDLKRYVAALSRNGQIPPHSIFVFSHTNYSMIFSDVRTRTYVKNPTATTA